LYSKIGRIVCPVCRREVRQDTPASILRTIEHWPAGVRFLIGFPLPIPTTAGALHTRGYSRVVAGNRTISLADTPADDEFIEGSCVVVDRLTTGKSTAARIGDSLEQAFRQGQGRCLVFAHGLPSDTGIACELDESSDWQRIDFSRELKCSTCGREFAAPEPRLFSANSPVGACPTCSGFGQVPAISFARVVPDPENSLADGAIAPWQTPAYLEYQRELERFAPRAGIPLNAPFRELSEEQRELIRQGAPGFRGLRGFFRWLERHVYKVGVRVFLSRWRTYEVCPDCHGQRLQPQTLAVRIADRNIAEVLALNVDAALEYCQQVPLAPGEERIARPPLEQLVSRLDYLKDVGLGYLTLDRPLRSLSGGERQRVALTTALGSRLVSTLYVLDEPSSGLHPQEVERLISAIDRLRDLGNTLVVVEHDESFLSHADHVVEIGPAAGRDGGRVVFHGPPTELAANSESLSGGYLSGRLKVPRPAARRTPSGQLRLTGARLHNLQNLDVDFPLGVLCAVAGASGSGKSTLVQETLYPLLADALKIPCDEAIPPGAVIACFDQIDEVLLVDQTPIGRSPRSNPITYLKAFDDIRKLFAETHEAKLRNFTASTFSFNTANGGRCVRCEGNGVIEIDMQFLADVSMTCPECHGSRYQRDVLEAKYRGLSIADVLAMTVREALPFFRGQPKLQRRLN
ncbi:MAG TPA: excinuclease ABC subunit UvrA, partial [Planctomycetaceae bacterium]|nr:excinuclease ABC subunit UvrA [Planctomycetaceae bacterium]